MSQTNNGNNFPSSCSIGRKQEEHISELSYATFVQSMSMRLESEQQTRFPARLQAEGETADDCCSRVIDDPRYNLFAKLQ